MLPLRQEWFFAKALLALQAGLVLPCQNAAWEGHKKKCVTDSMFEKVYAARLVGNWREVLKWEGRIGEMVEHLSNAGYNFVLSTFVHANMLGLLSPLPRKHSFDISPFLGSREASRDQARGARSA